jgi:peptide/nickel transport system substrate-binding protein
MLVPIAVGSLAFGARPAGAFDQPVSGVKLLLKQSSSGKQKLTFQSKDPLMPFPPNGGPEDPRDAGATIEVIGTAGRWLKDREMVEAVAGYWEAVGLKPKVRIFEFNEYLNRLFDRKTRGDAIFVVSSNELMDADKSFSAYYKAGGTGASNSDKELAGMIDAARSETDVAKRAALYDQAVKRAHEQAYFVWLLNIEDIYGVSKRLAWPGRVDAKMLVSEMKVK